MLVVDVVLLFIALNCSVDRCCKPDFSAFGSDSYSTFRLSHSFEFIPVSLTSSKASLAIAISLLVAFATDVVVVALAIVIVDILAGALHFAGRLTLYGADSVCNFASF